MTSGQSGLINFYLGCQRHASWPALPPDALSLLLPWGPRPPFHPEQVLFIYYSCFRSTRNFTSEDRFGTASTTKCRHTYFLLLVFILGGGDFVLSLFFFSSRIVYPEPWVVSSGAKGRVREASSRYVVRLPFLLRLCLASPSFPRRGGELLLLNYR